MATPGHSCQLLPSARLSVPPRPVLIDSSSQQSDSTVPWGPTGSHNLSLCVALLKHDPTTLGTHEDPSLVGESLQAAVTAHTGIHTCTKDLSGTCTCTLTHTSPAVPSGLRPFWQMLTGGW